jgi:hypothetical protein
MTDNHVIHRSSDLGAAKMQFIDKNLVLEIYVEYGIVHRAHQLGPAKIAFDGMDMDEEYMEDGILHRPPEIGPAVIAAGYPSYYITRYFERGVEINI